MATELEESCNFEDLPLGCGLIQNLRDNVGNRFTIVSTPEPLYNTVHYNTVLDITRIRIGPQVTIENTFAYITDAFYFQYNTVWMAYTETGLDPNKSVIKRLSRLMTKPTMWHVHPAKTRISLGTTRSDQSLRCALSG